MCPATRCWWTTTFSATGSRKETTGNLTDGSAHNLAAAPLATRDGVVGVLALINKEDGGFNDDDVTLLRAFSNPVATAVANARLFAESERQRAAIQATAYVLDQPLLILDERGQVLVANERAKAIVESHMSPLFDGISRALGRTIELDIGDETYLCSSEHVPGVGTIVVMQDITYVKELEAVRSELMHTITHDLKSPPTQSSASRTSWSARRRSKSAPTTSWNKSTSRQPVFWT